VLRFRTPIYLGKPAAAFAALEDAPAIRFVTHSAPRRAASTALGSSEIGPIESVLAK
jgi:hypothetical protein